MSNEENQVRGILTLPCPECDKENVFHFPIAGQHEKTLFTKDVVFECSKCKTSIQFYLEYKPIK